MTFKNDWEKTKVPSQLSADTIERMAHIAYPEKKLLSHQMIAGGCANLNIKIVLSDEHNPRMIRVYIRDKESAYREEKLGLLLKASIPIPRIDYVGDLDDYRFALTEYMPGMTLRDLLLSDIPHDVGGVMHDVGLLLSKITAHSFPKSGFFDRDLHISSAIENQEYLEFAACSLHHQGVSSQLTKKAIVKISDYLDRYSSMFPDGHEKNLVHADFDPANILVDQINGVWKITAVLDWEFSFSGSVLCDVANMLRYAHQMPSEFQDGFLSGLADGGVVLPEDWQTSIRLLNLVSLLDLLVRTDGQSCPKKKKDIGELIEQILNQDNACRA